MIPEIFIPEKLLWVFDDSDCAPGQIIRYRGSYGGRGSGKTRSFAIMLAVHGVILAQAGETGLLLCGREFMNTLADSSFAEVKSAIQSEQWLKDRYDIGDTYIRTKDRRIDFAFVGLRHNLDSIKSKAKIHILWVDEAERVSEACWQIVTPTVRESLSQIWVTWNPELKTSATNQRFRENPPKDAKIIELNWRDNKKFPDVLNKERLEDLEKRPDYYDHIWEGGYRAIVEGAYYAKHITAAKADGRITFIPEDPLMIVRLFVDIGGTGAKADNFVIIAAQFIGKAINVINHYEVQGQPISAHLAWLHGKGYTPDRTKIWLPHDGVTHDNVYDVSYETAFGKAGYNVEVVPNQGPGAAMARIEALRNIFHLLHFNKATTEDGLVAALGWYHEKKDPDRNIGLGVDHDWSSHSADAAGLMALVYDEPKMIKKPRRTGNWRTA